MSAKSACGRRFLKLEEAMPMNIVLEILHSLASLAGIGRFIFDLWREHKHNADDVER